MPPSTQATLPIPATLAIVKYRCLCAPLRILPPPCPNVRDVARLHAAGPGPFPGPRTPDSQTPLIPGRLLEGPSEHCEHPLEGENDGRRVANASGSQWRSWDGDGKGKGEGTSRNHRRNGFQRQSSSKVDSRGRGFPVRGGAGNRCWGVDLASFSFARSISLTYCQVHFFEVSSIKYN